MFEKSRGFLPRLTAFAALFLSMLLSMFLSLPTVAEEEQEVSFQQDILPQLMERCSYCHQAYDRQGYLVLEEETAYQSLVNVSSYQLPSMKRIEPGDAANSYVWLKGTNQHLEAGGYGWNMPIGWGLYGPFKDQLYLWIEQGAKNN